MPLLSPDLCSRESQKLGINYYTYSGRPKKITAGIIDEDIPVAIDNYIKEKKGDLLTTFTHELNLFEKIFARSVTRKLAYQGNIPLLAFKRKSVQ